MTVPPRKILLLGMIDSIHLARWIENSNVSREHEVLVIPTSPHRRAQTSILNASRSFDEGLRLGLKIHRALRYLSLFVWLLDRDFLLKGRFRALFIVSSIRKFKPDLIHVMETQNGGYPLDLAIKQLMKSKDWRQPTTLLTLFGSDIYWFSRFPDHERRLRSLLTKVTHLSAECSRDFQLAEELGFAGKRLSLMPVAGGIDSSDVDEPESAEEFAQRKKILVKGYGGIWGRGHIALEALGKLRSELTSYEIVVVSAERAARRSAKRNLQRFGIRVQVHRKRSLSFEEMLSLYRQSRIYIGLSLSDGLPSSFLEAMSQGAYPIQTTSACIDQVLNQSAIATGVDPEASVEQLASDIKKILSDDALALEAQHLNLSVVRNHYVVKCHGARLPFSYVDLT